MGIKRTHAIYAAGLGGYLIPFLRKKKMVIILTLMIRANYYNESLNDEEDTFSEIEIIKS
jgi:hypothetical protein